MKFKNLLERAGFFFMDHDPVEPSKCAKYKPPAIDMIPLK